MEAYRPEVLIVTDHLADRRGMELMLGEAGFAVRVAADDPDEARAELLTARYDVSLVEIRRRAGSGIGLARSALHGLERAPLVLCTASARPTGPLLAASGLGAPGLVLTSSAVGTLVEALRTVASGGTFTDPAVPEALAEGSGAAQRVSQLSAREREVLGLLADGFQGPEIAERLFLSLETVRTHIRNAAGKLGARTRVQAAAMVACTREEEA